jgi:peroxiredoxin
MDEEPGVVKEPTSAEWEEAEWDPGERSHQTWLRVIAFIAILGLFSYFVLRPAPAPEEKLPDFELEMLSGEGTFSRSDLGGKPAVINFWASWCGPCLDEMPLFEATWQRYKDEVVFLGVSVQDIPEKARRFATRLGITYPLVFDADQELYAEIGGGVGLPRTVFVTSDGTMLDGPSGGTVGTINEAELEAALRELTGRSDA